MAGSMLATLNNFSYILLHEYCLNVGYNVGNCTTEI